MTVQGHSLPQAGDSELLKGWQDYPIKPGSRNAVPTPALLLNEQLHSFAGNLFSSTISLRIIDIKDNGTKQPTSKLCEQATEIEDLLEEDGKALPRIRIISLHSAKALLPLKITETLMKKVLTRYNVDSDFLHVLFAFGDVPSVSESGSSNISSKEWLDGSRSVSYQIRYAEQNQRSEKQPWSVRQTGVYHHSSNRPSNESFDLFIILHPMANSLLEQQLNNLDQPEIASFCRDPFRLHSLSFKLYLDNWRWYFRYLGEQFEEKNDRIMIMDLETRAVVNLNFQKVQALRDLADTTLSLSGYCKSSLAVVKALSDIPESQLRNEWSMQPCCSRLEGFIESISALSRRIGNAIDLYAYALDLKNQYTAADTNSQMSKLAEKTTHDTTAVKWITYLTLIYLPGSFVATLFGMNFFGFSQEHRRIVVASNFWIYIVLWVPLTVMTYLGYQLMKSYQRSREDKNWHWLRRNRPGQLKEP